MGGDNRGGMGGEGGEGREKERREGRGGKGGFPMSPPLKKILDPPLRLLIT